MTYIQVGLLIARHKQDGLDWPGKKSGLEILSRPTKGRWQAIINEKKIQTSLARKLWNYCCVMETLDRKRPNCHLFRCSIFIST